MTVDIFGDVIDVDTVEQALIATLKAWMPSHLAHQERRAGLDAGTLKPIKNWPVVSEFRTDPQTKLPAIVVTSPGSVGAPTRNQKGEIRKTWRFEVAIVIGDRNEREARQLGSRYLAAITSALLQNRTLGGVAENTRNVGPDDHGYGQARAGGGQRAIYGTAFEVDVRNVVNDRLGPPEPPPDPHDPGALPESPLEAEILVTADTETP